MNQKQLIEWLEDRNRFWRQESNRLLEEAETIKRNIQRSNDPYSDLRKYEELVVEAQRALSNAIAVGQEARILKDQKKAKVLALEVPQEESEPLPFSEPPLDEEDTLQMPPVTDAPKEVPEEIQQVIGYLQQLIEDVEAGKLDTGTGLSIGQDQTLQAALSWVAYDESGHEDGEWEDEDEEDQQFWYDDYDDHPDCPEHGMIRLTNQYGEDVCAYCGDK
ncbi:MAG: hypothetical protein IT322_19880 [Anaerolineae bacterium]|nr:hypothetical protein [Anaerolineae bacterium]